MLRIEDVSVDLGDTKALDRVSLEVAAGETVTVLGPSGSGKSTLLRVVAGLLRPDSGRVLLEGDDLSAVPAHRRGIGLVFQDHALFQHRDVWGNVAFGLRMRGDPRGDIERRVRECLELVGLEGYEQRSVVTLSGGEQQRVALARALAPEPRVLLLDEPLGSLDRRLRDRLLEDLTAIFEHLDVTALHVTHDRAEAFALGDRVAVMRAGRIVQVGTPDEIWERPADEDTARFVGLNVLDGRAIRPEAVAALRAAEGGNGVVTASRSPGPDDATDDRARRGGTLDAVVAALDHPIRGDRVSVAVDEKGVIPLP